MKKSDILKELKEMAILGIASDAAIAKASAMSQQQIDDEFVAMSVSEAADLIVDLA